MIVMIT